MGLFGGEQTTYLKYQINLTDSARVVELQGGPKGSPTEKIAPLAPTVAAAQYDAPIADSTTGPIVYPATTSEWFVASNNFPRDQATFDGKSGGWFGISWLFGDTTHYIWRGEFNWVPASDQPEGTIIAPMPRRHFIDGFEMPDVGEWGTGNASNKASRRSSRSLQGFGLSLDCVALQKTHSRTTGGAPATQKAWDRFYLRIRRVPGAASQLWRCAGDPSPASGAKIEILPSGQLAVSAVDSGGGVTLLGTTSAPLALQKWLKIDILSTYSNTGTASEIRIFVNQVSVADFLIPAASGGLSGTSMASSTIGNDSANTANLDIDDWIGADFPTLSFTGNDWTNGSRVVLVRPTGRSADDTGDWVGDWRTLLQRPVDQVTPINLTSSVASARLSVATDAGSSVDQEPSALGYNAIIVGCYSQRDTGDGQIGYKLPGGADVLAISPEGLGGVFAWSHVLYRPGPTPTPLGPLAGLELLHIKDASTDACEVAALMASVELIGVFGPEDTLVAPGSVQRAPIGVHDAPYPRSPWARTGPPPISPVGTVTGTYVGNDTAQDLSFRFPVNFLWIRPSSVAPSGGMFWLSSMNSAHVSGKQANEAEAVADACADPAFVPGSVMVDTMAPADVVTIVPSEVLERVRYWLKFYNSNDDENYWMTQIILGPPPGQTPGWTADSYWSDKIGAGDGVGKGYVVPATEQQRYLVRIAGTNSEVNANGVTYHYVAYCDPGLRFLDCGALAAASIQGPFVTHLDADTFTPEFAFFQQEQAGNSATIGLYLKGLGHAATDASPATGASAGSSVTFSNGTLTSDDTLHANGISQIAYAVFRRDDGSKDTGIPGVLQLAHYTGDGSASRTIGLAPASGLRPAFAIVVPHNAALFYRDSAHTGTTSTQFPNSANASTGITGGGIDSLSVGSALNSNGIVYDVFILPGGATACNGGFSCDGEFITVAPGGGGNPPYDPPYFDPPFNPPPTDGGGGGGGTDDGPGDNPGDGVNFAPGCVAASQRVINLALSRVGVSQQVGDIVNEKSRNASTCRLWYSEDVDATLREFDWPFATRYAVLALVGGTATVPVNADWQYSYRVPSDMMKARRIVNPDGARRNYDPHPPKWRLGGDNLGSLIYTNEITPTLEYTVRPICPASLGDAIYRSALAWRHAHSIAPSLSRDKEKVLDCWKMYLSVAGTACTVAAQEEQQAPGGGPDWLTTRNGLDINGFPWDRG